MHLPVALVDVDAAMSCRCKRGVAVGALDGFPLDVDGDDMIKDFGVVRQDLPTQTADRLVRGGVNLDELLDLVVVKGLEVQVSCKEKKASENPDQLTICEAYCDQNFQIFTYFRS